MLQAPGPGGPAAGSPGSPVRKPSVSPPPPPPAGGSPGGRRVVRFVVIYNNIYDNKNNNTFDNISIIYPGMY